MSTSSKIILTYRFQIFSALMLAFFLSACEKINDDESHLFKEGKGFFILNEGGWQKANASVSYRYFEGDSSKHQIFETANGYKLGDVLQDMMVNDSLSYLVVNNSGYIKVVRTGTFEEKTTIKGFNSPRSILKVNNTTAFVSDLYAGQIYVVDLVTNTISDSIKSGVYIESMVLVNGKVYVTLPSVWGLYNSDQILVIDPVTKIITGTFTVGLNPYQIIADQNGHLWIFCMGDAWASPAVSASIHWINPSTNDRSFIDLSELPVAYSGTMALNKTDKKIYFLYGDLYQIDISGNQYPVTKLAAFSGRTTYGLGFDETNDHIYVSHVKDSNQNGSIIKYDLVGKQLEEFSAGVIPSKFIFF
jgi:DNA-binding beta-propeller fold protein YncE